jgi:uncharacterized protein
MLKELKEGIQITLKVTPRSGKNIVVGFEGDYLKVRLKAIPEKGNANLALIELLADFFGVAPSKITLTAGQTSRFKRVIISGSSIQELTAKLAHLPTE